MKFTDVMLLDGRYSLNTYNNARGKLRDKTVQTSAND